MTKNIAETIRNNDLSAYQAIRYPNIQDGEPLVFTDEDFSNTDFEQFSMGFAEFHNCILDGATHLYGQPIVIENSSARKLDIRGARLILRAMNSDFTGMQYDKATELVYGASGADARSSFTGCVLDDQTKADLVAQGVEFSED